MGVISVPGDAHSNGLPMVHIYLQMAVSAYFGSVNEEAFSLYLFSFTILKLGRL